MNQKKRLFGLFLALLFCDSSMYAQHEEKACNINLSIGIRTGSTTWDQGNLNSAASFEYFFTKNQSFELGFEANSLHRTIANSDVSARILSMGGALHHHYTFYTNDKQLSKWSNRFYLYTVAGVAYVQEKLSDPRDVPTYLSPKDPRNVFGVDVGMGAELNFSSFFSLFASVVPRWEFSYKEWVMQGNVGAKFYF